jgi:hypothetical protein
MFTDRLNPNSKKNQGRELPIRKQKQEPSPLSREERRDVLSSETVFRYFGVNSCQFLSILFNFVQLFSIPFNLFQFYSIFSRSFMMTG